MYMGRRDSHGADPVQERLVGKDVMSPTRNEEDGIQFAADDQGFGTVEIHPVDGRFGSLSAGSDGRKDGKERKHQEKGAADPIPPARSRAFSWVPLRERFSAPRAKTD